MRKMEKMMTELSDKLRVQEREFGRRSQDRLAEADQPIIIDTRRRKDWPEPTWKDVLWFMFWAAVASAGLCWLLISRAK